MGIGNYWTSQLTLEISPWQVVWPRVVVIRRAVHDLRATERRCVSLHFKGTAGGRGRLLALLRNEGGSVGTSIAKTIHERRTSSTLCVLANISIR